jgi:teichoic acid glycerol-phosphate primase
MMRGMQVRVAGFLYGPLEHHLDHIAPLCGLRKIPLIVTDEEVARQARLYYPDVEILEYSPLDVAFRIVQEFDTLYYTIPLPAYNEIFFLAEQGLNKNLKTVWVPHGNSDKGHRGPYFEALADETELIVYGAQMLELLRLKGIHAPCTQVGNFRLRYYEQHHAFYQSLIESWANPHEKVVLYAPTWEEEVSSFFEETERLIAQIPPKHLLWIKPHPNLELNILTEHLALKYQHHPQVRFIRHFSPIYPLLERADVYLGDASSVGYDFLAFNRPMFFFNPHNLPRALHECGRSLVSSENFFEIVAEDSTQSHLSQVREEMYNYVFENALPER